MNNLFDDAPIALHSKVMDEVCEGDRIWFEENPTQRCRLRDGVQYEFNDRFNPVPPGMSVRVIVINITEGVRARAPVALPSEISNENHGLDLMEIFKSLNPEMYAKLFMGQRNDN